MAEFMAVVGGLLVVWGGWMMAQVLLRCFGDKGTKPTRLFVLLRGNAGEWEMRRILRWVKRMNHARGVHVVVLAPNLAGEEQTRCMLFCRSKGIPLFTRESEG